ncbi:hypothetical protein AB0N07_48465 [Streptomyces sp. NPDC051172]|uniref:hypothetical protein n=1 Tax=Streptomyces sp. NPDC051172 TaxID=3155796 RepID=UPI00341FACF3
MLTDYQTPAAIRRAGVPRLEPWLKNRGVKNASSLAETAFGVAQAQHIAPAGEQLVPAMVARIAKGVLALDAETGEPDALIEACFHEHPHAKMIETLPSMGPPRLGAEFIAATGKDLVGIRHPGSAGRLRRPGPSPATGHRRGHRRSHRRPDAARAGR